MYDVCDCVGVCAGSCARFTSKTAAVILSQDQYNAKLTADL